MKYLHQVIYFPSKMNYLSFLLLALQLSRLLLNWALFSVTKAVIMFYGNHVVSYSCVSPSCRYCCGYGCGYGFDIYKMSSHRLCCAFGMFLWFMIREWWENGVTDGKGAKFIWLVVFWLTPAFVRWDFSNRYTIVDAMKILSVHILFKLR